MTHTTPTRTSSLYSTPVSAPAGLRSGGLALAAALTLVAVGCQVEPIPSIQIDLREVVVSSVSVSEPEAAVVGRAAAAPPLALVVATNDRTSTSAEAQTTNNGEFLMQLAAQAGDTLSVVVHIDSAVLGPVQLTVPDALAPGAPARPGSAPSSTVTATREATGDVRVAGSADSVPPLASVLVASAVHVQTVDADSAGAFVAVISATAQESIAVTALASTGVSPALFVAAPTAEPPDTEDDGDDGDGS